MILCVQWVNLSKTINFWQPKFIETGQMFDMLCDYVPYGTIGLNLKKTFVITQRKFQVGLSKPD